MNAVGREREGWTEANTKEKGKGTQCFFMTKRFDIIIISSPKRVNWETKFIAKLDKISPFTPSG